MTPTGSLHGQFQRTVVRGNLLQAVATARELRRLSLSDSFALLLVFADKHLTRFERAGAARCTPSSGRRETPTIVEAQATFWAARPVAGFI